MKILFVGFSYSVHLARWIELVSGEHDVHVFPSQDYDAPHPALRDVTYWPARPEAFAWRDGLRRPRFSPAMAERCSRRGPLASYLAAVVEEGGFAVVHSMEMQHAGALALDARGRVRGRFPTWIVTNYGSDIAWHGREPEGEAAIRAQLAVCDLYGAECARDVALARAHGFHGPVFTLCPNGGGLDLPMLAALRDPTPPSRRRVVAVKGYQHFVGRALAVLEALDRVREELLPFEVVVHSPAPEVEGAAAALRAKGMEIRCLPAQVPQEEILALHGRARLSVANSLCDGISTSLLEAMAMGAFPVQSRTACADEWLEDGVTGLLTDPEDVEGIAAALRRALTDDALVDAAAPRNAACIAGGADRERLRATVRAAYAALEPPARPAFAPRPVPRPLPWPARSAPERPVLTVITPAYNRADFLPETIASVLGQEFGDFEYLILDDGSSDGTAEVVARHADPRIRFSRHANMGETRTVNRALRQARGDFIAIVNSDDPAVPGAFGRLLGVLHAAPEALMAYPDWVVIDPASQPLEEVRMRPFTLEALLTRGNVPIGPGAMFRARVVEEVGLRDPLLRYSADLDYVIRTALAGPILHVPEVLGTHRHHPGSASVSDRGERLAREAMYPYLAYAEHPRLSPALRRRRGSARAAACFAAAHITPDGRWATRLLAEGFLADPQTILGLAADLGLERLADRLAGSAPNGAAARAALDAALAARSRAEAARPLLRALLGDPGHVLGWLARHGRAHAAAHLRSLPATRFRNAPRNPS